MPKRATKHIPGVGPVLFEGSIRSRRFSITVRPFKGVRVALPSGSSIQQAEFFVCENLAWIQRALLKTHEQEKQEAGWAGIMQGINREDARKILSGRLNELAELHGFSYNKVSIRQQKTRWGSCSAKNNISLNIKLLILPEELRDLILIHELVHTRIKNHSPKFWDLLLKIEPRARELDRQIRGFSCVPPSSS